MEIAPHDAAPGELLGPLTRVERTLEVQDNVEVLPDPLGSAPASSTGRLSSHPGAQTPAGSHLLTAGGFQRLGARLDTERVELRLDALN